MTGIEISVPEEMDMYFIGRCLLLHVRTAFNWGEGAGRKKKTHKNTHNTMKNMYDVFKKPQLWKKCLLLKAVPCNFILIFIIL